MAKCNQLTSLPFKGLTCWESLHESRAISTQTHVLLLFMFLISLVHHYHSALLHRHALIMDRLFTFLVVFSTLVLKPSFPQSPSTATYHFLRLIWNLTTQCLTVTGGGSVGECSRLSQPSWLWVNYNIVILTCLFALDCEFDFHTITRHSATLCVGTYIITRSLLHWQPIGRLH